MKKQPNNRPNPKKKAISASSMRLALENRLLFDGAVVAAAQAVDDQAADAQPDPACPDSAQDAGAGGAAAPFGNFFDDSHALATQPTSIQAVSAGNHGAPNLLVVDPRADGIAQLLAKPPTQTDIRVLKPDQDGYRQIADILQERGDTVSIHIQASELNGRAYLGNSPISQTLSAGDSQAIIDWGDKLAQGAQIIFHGEQGQVGQSWLTQFQALTGGQTTWTADKICDHENVDAAQNTLADADDSTLASTIINAAQANDQAQDDFTPAAVSASPPPVSLVFVDTGVSGYQTLLQGIGPNDTVILLDPTKDGIEQIAQTVAEYNDIQAIHIISHGDAGQLRVDTALLNETTMQGEYADELATVHQHLSASADILIYGCDFGQGEIGIQAVNLLASLTQADVAASVDDTGAAALGGNWVLELTTGGIESATLQAKDWQGLLVTAPGLTVPGTTQTTNEDTAKVFSAANGNAITVSDIDDEPQTITLTATNGLLTLGSLAGITFTAGDGTTDTTMTFTGSVAAVNNALNGLSYQPTANYNGPAQITVKTSDPSSVAPGWVNGGFEQGSTTPTFQIVNETAVVGWDTDATDNRIEIWRSGFQGVPSHSGSFFAEMNANQVGALFQTFDTEANSDVKVTFAHRGRQGVDRMRVNVFDLGADDAVGGTGVNADTLLFSKTYSDGNTAWGVYSDTVTNAASGNAYRFEFRSISAAGGSASIGNFVDSINIVQALADVKAINLNIQAVNDAPTVSLPGSIATSEDTPTAITGITFADIDGGNTGVDVTFRIPPGTGTLSWVNTPFISAVVTDGGRTITLGGTKAGIENAIAANVLTFTPTANFNGNVALTVSIDDRGNTGTDPGLTGAPTTEAGSGVTTIVVASVNDPPAATPLTTSGNEDTLVPVNLTGTDIDGTVTNATITTLPPATQGILFLADGTTPVVAGVPLTAAQAAGIIFRPAPNFNGTVTVPFTVTDNNGAVSPPLDAVIIVNDVNDPPVATPAAISDNEDTPIPLSLTGTDVDGTIANIVVSMVPVAQGTLYLADGVTPVTNGQLLTPAQVANLIFVPAPNFNGTVRIPFNVIDNNGAISPVADAVITVNAANDLPVATATSANTQEGTPTAGITLTGTDVDGSVASVTVAALPPVAEGVLYFADGVTPVAAGAELTPAQATGLVYVPAPNFNGTVNIPFTVTDNLGATSAPANIGITVVPNTPPLANNDGPIATEPNAPATGNVLANDRDPDGDPLRVTEFTIPGVGTFPAGQTATIPGVGTLIINPDGSYSFTPNKGYSGPVPGAVYTVSDPTGATATATLSFANAPRVASPANGDNIGAIIMLANPTTPSNLAFMTGARYSLPQFREPNLNWSSDQPNQPSRLNLYGSPLDYDLFLTGSLRNQVVLELKGYSFSVPPSAFRHSNPNEALEYDATQLAGSPLPSWLHFDSKQLKFSGIPPKGAQNTEVKVIARDRYGNEAEGTFTVIVNEEVKDADSGPIRLKAKPSADVQGNAQIKPEDYQSPGAGKLAFSEQLSQSGKLSRIVEARAMLDSLGQL